MCVAFFTLDHPDYALILCSNRDEYLSRPTEPAHFCRDALSGVDVKAGGTWLGLTRTGKLALLTNVTEEHAEYPTSRGQLVASFLASPARSLEDDARTLYPASDRYAGFNLVLLAPQESGADLAYDALYVTNHGGGGPITHRTLTPAERHRTGMSNGVDGHGADEWPRIRQGVHLFDTLLTSLAPDTSDDELAERLFDLLTWRSSRPPREHSELKNTIHVEPLMLAGDMFGTRLSTVVLVKRNGDVLFSERDKWVLSTQGRPILADPSSQRVFRFKISRCELSSSGI